MQLISVVIDTVSCDAVAVYCNGVLVWPRIDWKIMASCRGLGADRFVSLDSESPPLVKQLCPSCPVRAECEHYGRATRSVGWWGGVRLALAPTRLRRDRQARLTWERVTEMRRRYAAGGVTQRQLADDYGVGFDQVSAIIRGKSWKSEHPRQNRHRQLTDADEAAIRERYAAGGVTHKALAEEYGVGRTTVTEVLTGRLYEV